MTLLIPERRAAHVRARAERHAQNVQNVTSLIARRGVGLFEHAQRSIDVVSAQLQQATNKSSHSQANQSAYPSPPPSGHYSPPRSGYYSPPAQRQQHYSSQHQLPPSPPMRAAAAASSSSSSCPQSSPKSQVYQSYQVFDYEDAYVPPTPQQQQQKHSLRLSRRAQRDVFRAERRELCEAHKNERREQMVKWRVGQRARAATGTHANQRSNRTSRGLPVPSKPAETNIDQGQQEQGVVKTRTRQRISAVHDHDNHDDHAGDQARRSESHGDSNEYGVQALIGTIATLMQGVEEQLQPVLPSTTTTTTTTTTSRTHNQQQSQQYNHTPGPVAAVRGINPSIGRAPTLTSAAAAATPSRKTDADPMPCANRDQDGYQVDNAKGGIFEDIPTDSDNESLSSWGADSFVDEDEWGDNAVDDGGEVSVDDDGQRGAARSSASTLPHPPPPPPPSAPAVRVGREGHQYQHQHQQHSRGRSRHSTPPHTAGGSGRGRLADEQERRRRRENMMTMTTTTTRHERQMLELLQAGHGHDNGHEQGQVPPPSYDEAVNGFPVRGQI